jgi:hypothetical protein
MRPSCSRDGSSDVAILPITIFNSEVMSSADDCCGLRYLRGMRYSDGRRLDAGERPGVSRCS